MTMYSPEERKYKKSVAEQADKNIAAKRVNRRNPYRLSGHHRAIMHYLEKKVLIEAESQRPPIKQKDYLLGKYCITGYKVPITAIIDKVDKLHNKVHILNWPYEWMPVQKLSNMEKLYNDA